MADKMKDILENLNKHVADFSALVSREEELINQGDVLKIFELAEDKERVVHSLINETSSLRGLVAPNQTLGSFLKSQGSYNMEIEEVRGSVSQVMKVNEMNFLKIQARAQVDEEFLCAMGFLEKTDIYDSSAGVS